ncbi:Uncharacterised protein [Streptococcus criceti]|uniref:Uncharacterized protein n=1 Tax=Streptococcus criceti HS-6 TaxID=873449 RepID=G5JQ17_STRCG|nr:hypothetical protein STRCR_0464 [Streptococcus criceti HS-6]SUN41925.1 Uncharacterised protein [Streptococcus criceti]
MRKGMASASYFLLAFLTPLVSYVIEHGYDTVQKDKDFLDARHLRQLSYFAVCRLRLCILNKGEKYG